MAAVDVDRHHVTGTARIAEVPQRRSLLSLNRFARLKPHKLLGTPAIPFFDARAHEIESTPVVGFQGAARFGQTLANAGL